jgi:hypothetical protein
MKICIVGASGKTAKIYCGSLIHRNVDLSEWYRLMRYATLVLTIFGSLYAFSAAAQSWFEFVEAEELFSANFPHTPTVQEFTYHSGYHAELPAKKYTASDAQADYSVIIVNFAPTQLTGQRAAWDLRGSVAHAAWDIRKRGGEITHDDWVQIDRIDGHQLQIINLDQTRSYVQIHSHGTRLYIVEARAVPEATPPIHFQQSLSILDENGDIVRYANDFITRVEAER